MSELSIDLVAFWVSAQPEILSLLFGGLLVLAVTARKPISIRAQKHRREARRN
jgi:hypothetical protein